MSLNFEISPKQSPKGLAQGVGPSELARRIGTTPQKVNRLVDVRHTSKLESIEQAVRALGTQLTPNLGHAAMMDVFGMLAIALMVFVLRQHGYWHARSLDYMGSERSRLIEWLRLPGDLVFILFGATPLVIAAIKGYLGVRAAAAHADN